MLIAGKQHVGRIERDRSNRGRGESGEPRAGQDGEHQCDDATDEAA